MDNFKNKMKAMVDEHKHQKTTDHTQQTSAQDQPSALPSTGQPNGESHDPEGAISTHNKARSAKKLSDLQWDHSLAKDAQAYAEKLAAKNKMEHAGVQGQGENLYMSTGDATYDQAVQAWLGEEKDYNGERIGEGDFTKWGHFSQCLWYSTTHVGMGKATAKNGSTYIVARYTPQGNMAGEKPF